MQSKQKETVVCFYLEGVDWLVGQEAQSFENFLIPCD
jgi:hypothetical protein